MKLFEKAKRADLVEAARANGFELRKQGSGWSAKHCPHCSEGSSVMPLSLFARDGLWRWNCFKCNRGGSVVDFCAAIWGCTEMEAANNNIKTVYIVEGVIDMLSMVELGLKDGDAILAMPGTSSWQERWFSALHERHPGVRFILALDSDAPGKKAAEEIMKVLEKLKAPIMQVESPRIS